MSMVARREALALRPDDELRALAERASGAGAIVSFTGLARPASNEGVAVERLVLDYHPTLTLRSLEQIAADALARFDVSHVHVVHRSGDIAPGEPVVFAGAASAHRRAAFEAVDYLMDRLKTEAVFWKREVGEGGSRWVEPTEADYADRERWG
jgi:molybdopterin synthase catalytic subunit